MIEDTQYLGQPVRSLQAMLRELSYYYPAIPRITQNGVFDKNTQEAVRAFQREFQLPVSGQVDNATWDAVVLAYNKAFSSMQNPRELPVYPDAAYTIGVDTSCVHLFVIQAMFKTLSYMLEEVVDCPVDGINTGVCTENIRWLQRKGGIAETGILTKLEWDLLSRLYQVFITRSIDAAACYQEGRYPPSAQRTEH